MTAGERRAAGWSRPWDASIRALGDRQWIMAARAYPDAWAALCLLILAVIVEWPLLSGGTVVGQDAVAAFYPWYSFLGETLRSGHLPGWNPYSMSGVPFAADPQSGWTYAPAMALFALLPLEAAAEGFMFLHLAGSALGMYALARVVGMGLSGAMVAAVAYGFNVFVYERNICCFAYTGILLWLPVLLLGTELAIRERRWLHKGIWWGAAGLALSQCLAIWLGQGTYYVLLALGGYVAYRALVAPPGHLRSGGARLATLVLNSVGVGGLGLGLAAAGVLPRLEYNRISNLSQGYSFTPAQAVVGGWVPKEWSYVLDRGDWHYAGVAVVALAVLAPVIARTRFSTPYWSSLWVAALVLTTQAQTPLHQLLGLLPRFSELHGHHPERILVLFYLGVAMAAGAGWEAWLRAAPGPRYVVAVISLGTALVVAAGTAQTAVTLSVLGTFVVLATGIAGRSKHAATTLLLVLVFADLFHAGYGTVQHGLPFFKKVKVELDSYYEPGGGVEFLRSQLPLEPFRYLGYDPSINADGILYRFSFDDPRTAALAVNNRSTLLRLQEVQGYNPVHLARYDEYLQAMNGRPQEYRSAYLYPSGLKSPLLNLLNARYIIVPASLPPGRTDVQTLMERHTTVYADARVKVLENRDALPRAWITHHAQEVQSGDALRLLTTGTVDPRETALLEEPPPVLGRPDDVRKDVVRFINYQPGDIRLRAATASAGMLVFSEIYYPGWKAYVDGKPAHIYVTNHLLRSIALPAGEHMVELRFESDSLRLGLSISATTFLMLALLAASLALNWKTSAHKR